MLERIQKANDIKDLKPEELPELAQEIRKFLVEKISKNRRTSGIESRRSRTYNGNASGL